MGYRLEQDSDHAGVRQLNLAGFESPAEADLVDVVRGASGAFALVAESDDELVGHVLFSPVELTKAPGRQAVGLAPMTVAPQRRRRGIGSSLVREGLVECRRRGVQAVLVLGYPAFYQRFGFRPAERYGLSCGLAVAAEAFMALPLVPGGLAGAAGGVRFHPALESMAAS